MRDAPGDELQLHKGEIVAVWEEGSGGWLLGSVVMSADGSLVPEGASGWFPANLTTRFPPPIHVHLPQWCGHDIPIDEYSPFAERAPSDFPTSMSLTTRLAPDCDQKQDFHGHHLSPSRFQAGAHSTRGSVVEVKTSRARTDSDKKLPIDEDAMTLSETDSDDSCTSISNTHPSVVSHRSHSVVDRGQAFYSSSSMSGNRQHPVHIMERRTCAAVSTTARTDRSISPQYWTNRSLSAIDDVTVRVTVTFTNEVLEGESRDISLRRLAASLITRYLYEDRNVLSTGRAVEGINARAETNAWMNQAYRVMIHIMIRKHC